MASRRAHELFDRAVRSLATNPAVIQTRLGLAWRHLTSVPIEEIPEPYRGDVEDLRRRWDAAKPIGDEGTAMAAANRLSDDEAIEEADRILSIEYRLRDG